MPYFPPTYVPTADETTGVWTPVLGGTGGQTGQSYALQQGFYVKNESKVWVFCRVTLSNKGTITGNLQISGFPFAFKGGGVYMATAPVMWVALANAQLNVTVVGNSGATTAHILARSTTTTDLLSGGVVTTTMLGNTSEIVFSMEYSI